MDYKELLVKFGYAEGVDFDENCNPIQATRKVLQVIQVPEVPAVLNAQGGVITNMIPAHDETSMVDQNYTTTVPSEEDLRVDDGRDARRKCTRALNIVYSFNKELTAAQIQTMMTDHAQALFFLEKNYPSKALEEVQAIVPDGVIVTQKEKDMIIAVLSSPPIYQFAKK